MTTDDTNALVPAFSVRNGVKPRGRTTSNISTSPDWPEWVKEALFVRWEQEGQHMPRAIARMEAEWDDVAELEYDPETGDVTPMDWRPIPLQTGHAWKRRYHWELLAAQIVAASFPELDFKHRANNVIIGDIAQRELRELLQDPAVRPETKAILIKTALEVRGSGTYGNKDRRAAPPRQVVTADADLEAMSEEELNALQAQVIRNQRSQRPEEQ
jgi:hypothetical protein